MSPTPVFVGTDPFQAAASNPSVAPKSIPSVPPILPFEPLVQEATPIIEVRDLQVSSREVEIVPELSRALGNSRDRPWALGELLTTLLIWFLTRTGDARRRGGERDELASELQRVREELRRSREYSLRRADAYERPCLDRDRYRGEHDALRGSRAAVARDYGELPTNSAHVHRGSVRNPYATISSYEDVHEIPRHPGYCPPDPCESGSAGAFPKSNP